MHAHVPFNSSHKRIDYLYKLNKHTKRVLVVFCELFFLLENIPRHTSKCPVYIIVCLLTQCLCQCRPSMDTQIDRVFYLACCNSSMESPLFSTLRSAPPILFNLPFKLYLARKMLMAIVHRMHKNQQSNNIMIFFPGTFRTHWSIQKIKRPTIKCFGVIKQRVLFIFILKKYFCMLSVQTLRCVIYAKFFKRRSCCILITNKYYKKK